MAHISQIEKDSIKIKEESIKVLEEVGVISYRALLKARDMIKPGVRLLDVANTVEKFVIEEGRE